MKSWKLLAFIFIFLLPSPFVTADWVWSPEQGKFINTEENTQSNADDIFDNALDFYKEKKLPKAIEQFQLILKKYPKSRVAPEAQYRLGTIFEEQGDFVKAHKAYQALIKSYPQSERFEEVVEREYQLGNAFLSGKKGKVMGLEVRPSLPLAIEVFKEIVESAPYSSFGDKAQFNIGVAYQRSGKYDDAGEAFQNLIDQYPQSSLVQQARLQMAEVAYAKASTQTRDQGALDVAAQQAKGYLQRYPNAEDAEKASRIQQAVDERNAEKNYRIGLYYEKDNYLESALIYYRDTAKRYASTSWGQKAADKLQSLEEPVKYLHAKTDAIQKELSDLEARYQSLGKDKKTEKAQLKKEIQQLKKRLKAIDKNKIRSLNRRKQDLKRREAELKEKFKELERKKKRYKNNTSVDFQKAIARWQASLEAERDLLAQEKDRLAAWRTELGVPEGRFFEGFVPFGQPETPLEKIQGMSEKDLYQLSRKKKELFEKKEKLYKRYNELQAQLVPPRSETGLKRKRLRGIEKTDSSKPVDPKLAARQAEILGLEAKLDDKKALYEKHFGKVAEQELEALLAKRFGESQALNPLEVKSEDLKTKNLQSLLELKMHLQEKITTQQNIVQTLSTAFDKELAMQEQQTMMQSLEKDTDGRKLRKEIKKVEKDLRKRYQDIQDRNQRKNQLLEELDEVLHPKEQKHAVLRAAAKPVTGTVYLAKAFLLGLPNEDVELTKAASQPKEQAEASGKVQKLKEEIELESLMIQAQEQEIMKLEKEREILNARASLAGGMKFRSSLVKVPYAFIDEAIQSARRIIPKKDRKEVLLNRLDQQTQELEALKKKQEITEALIKEKTPAPEPVPVSGTATPGAVSEKTEPTLPVEPASGDGTAASVTSVKAEPTLSSAKSSKNKKASVSQVPDEKELRDEIIRLQEQLEVSYSVYAQEQGIILGILPTGESPKDTEGAKKYRELQEIIAELSRVIDEELNIESQEKAILEKRIHEVDKVLPTVTSKAMQQDLTTEKERMRQRLQDLATRHDFLSKEKERFNKA